MKDERIVVRVLVRIPGTTYQPDDVVAVDAAMAREWLERGWAEAHLPRPAVKVVNPPRTRRASTKGKE